MSIAGWIAGLMAFAGIGAASWLLKKRRDDKKLWEDYEKYKGPI